MPLHLFSTPVQCTQCGTVVDDPMVDKCPQCGNLLKERRTPSRLAGVPRRYGQLRFMIGMLRLLGVITVALAILLFLFSEETMPWSTRSLILLGGLVVATWLFVVGSVIDVAVDIEENTRSTFRVQQMILDELHEGRIPPIEGG